MLSSASSLPCSSSALIITCLLLQQCKTVTCIFVSTTRLQLEENLHYQQQDARKSSCVEVNIISINLIGLKLNDTYRHFKSILENRNPTNRFFFIYRCFVLSFVYNSVRFNRLIERQQHGLSLGEHIPNCVLLIDRSYPLTDSAHSLNVFDMQRS